MFKRHASDPRPTQQLVVDHATCLACGACVAVCPPRALTLDHLHLHVIQPACTACDRCTDMCPVQALAFVPSVQRPAS
ncbi:MAG: 4Fe-4S binding protein [Anaerolineae bacterium]|nr:4Fe-4S binding protein [Anaerolineae bacterium]